MQVSVVQKKFFQGYTLIELLVAISIIALLTMIGVTNFRVANQKAKDGKRKGDLEQIKAALELYRTEVGKYPSDTGSLSPTYMGEIPSDPNGSAYYYNTPDLGLTYNLCAALEIDTTGSCGGASCGDSTCNYQISSPL